MANGNNVAMLSRKRGSKKAQLTHFSKFLDQFTITEQEREHVLNDEMYIQIRQRLVKIENVFEEFLEIQSELEACVDDSLFNEQFEKRLEFEDSYYEIVSKAKSIFKRDKSYSELENYIHSVQNSHNSSNRGKGSNFCGIKLPEIPLPKFQGDYESWLEFRDTLKSLIHENDFLTNMDKFYYFRASLDGAAAQVIKNLEIIEINYPFAIFSLESIQKESCLKIRELVDDLSKHLRSLNQLGQNTENWDTLLIFIVVSKLDNNTSRDWEKHTATNCQIGKVQLPQFNNLKQFLKNRADMLEILEFKNREKYSNSLQDKFSKFRDKGQNSKSFFSVIPGEFTCFYCNDKHSIYTCQEFLHLDVQKRKQFLEKSKLCPNCLRSGYAVTKCRLGPCRKCKGWHNSLLHPLETNSVRNTRATSTAKNNSRETTAANVESSIAEQASLTNSNTSTLTSTSFINNLQTLCVNYVILATAQVIVVGKNGQQYKVRAVLDGGSQSSFISSELVKLLGIYEQEANLEIDGLANSRSSSFGKCTIEIHSPIKESFTKRVTCFTLPQIIQGDLPRFAIDFRSLNIPENKPLPGNDFYKPGPVHILLGGDVFWEVLRPGEIQCGKQRPTLKNTVFGWIVGAPTSGSQQHFSLCSMSINNQELHTPIAKFWEIEECTRPKPFSSDELQCEQIFSETTTRTANGRFSVNMPLKKDPECLGESKSAAEKRFNALEKRLSKDAKLKTLYHDFMREYIDLKHMSLESQHDQEASVQYFTPHHGVFQADSLTTKLRVVFDASAPSSSGISLNDIQLIGPVLQDDLFAILIRFRKYEYVISADNAKMYHQVAIAPSQRNLQKILWRFNLSDNLQTYVLNTVTYGQASASYLAIRCLISLAEECADLNPEISRIIKHDFYVDDMLTGANTREDEVSAILKTGRFELRKYYSNCDEVTKDLKPDQTFGILELGPNEKAKNLELMWKCQTDCLTYNIENESLNHTQQATKRIVLSLISKIFDPLGLLSPCTILAKIIMQRLWLAKIPWDDPLPDTLHNTWNKFKGKLSLLNELNIERHAVIQNPISIELHGFADASTQAYGACIYIRSTSANSKVQVTLLCAKSKVAPIKTITVPKLELCAALLLARLVDKVIRSININFQKVTLWSDSTVVLAWLKACPNALKAFVANRVSEIQTLTKEHECMLMLFSQRA